MTEEQWALYQLLLATDFAAQSQDTAPRPCVGCHYEQSQEPFPGGTVSSSLCMGHRMSLPAERQSPNSL